MSRRQGKIIKEWIELTLCDLVDDILYSRSQGMNSEETFSIIKKYAQDIHQAIKQK